MSRVGRALATALGTCLVVGAIGLLVPHLAKGLQRRAALRLSQGPARIVSLAPSITETLFAIGAGDRVVGVTSHCDYPAGVTLVARVGGYDTPNVEVIVALRPDLVIAPEEGALRAPVKQLEDFGIPVATVKTSSLDSAVGAIDQIGDQVRGGAGERAALLRDALFKRSTAVREATRDRPRVRTLIVVDRDPTVGAGPGTFLDALLRDAGGENVLTSGPGYPQLSTEAIEGLAPDAILDLCMVKDSSERDAAAKARWQRHPELAAVKSGRIIAIDPDLLVRPGPRLIDGLEKLARALHPEAFSLESAPR